MSGNTLNHKRSRFVSGGQTEVSSWAIEHWEPGLIPKDPSDIVYVVEKVYENRPRMLGLLFYGNEQLWWIIGVYNGIIDPHEELVEGKIILVPMLDRALGELAKSSGVVYSTRII
jgi:hypothetical protein